MDSIKFYVYGRRTMTGKWYIDQHLIANRMYQIHSGKVNFVLNGKKYPLKTECIYVFPQNLKFELDYPDDFCIDHAFFDFVTVPVFSSDSFLEIILNEHPLIACAAEICFKLAQKYPMQTEADEYYNLIKSYFGNLLWLIDREVPLKTICDLRINNALAYIHQNYAEEITLNDLASVAFLEKNYFIKLFQKQMGKSPYQYLKNVRLSIAMNLIAQGTTVTDAAYRIGYANVSAFSNAVKKVYGKYPVEVVGRH